MTKNSTFGAKLDQLGRLLTAIGLDKSCAPEEGQGDPTAPLPTPERLAPIGGYKLLRLLGEGGMGMVYLAEQTSPIRRKVALKVIKPGMDSKRVIARFEAERQALALLDHPNIAQVHDAGTTDSGRPYFVMEYVTGSSITDYCDRHKLTIEDRLHLFQQVCHAVHHAHQKGIVHRDLKPSNVLVSAEGDEGIPKIIDFGVAKAMSQPLTERTLFTEDSQLLGTPEYMSPEQADMANEDIDTRSDIYSLGVLLYVLLAGILPYDSQTFRHGGMEHIRKIIRETDPKTPSTRLTKLGEEATKLAANRRTELATLTRRLHRELEWIPLKAMRKDRAERYRSASEFADDIENYLNGTPLMAGPRNAGYRLKKFVRRNRVLVAAVSVVAATLILGLAATTTMYLRAEHQAQVSEAVSTFLRDDLLASVDPERGMGRNITIRSFLDRASESLNGKFTNEPLVEASIRDTIGWTYRNLSEYEAAEPHLERALQIRREHLGTQHPDTFDSIGRLAWLRCDQAQYQDAADLLEEAISTCRRVRGDEHARTLGFANTLGCVYIDLGRYDEAERLYLKSIPRARRVLGVKDDLSFFMVGNLGQTYERQGRYDEAKRQYLEMLQLREGVWDDENVWTLLYKGFLARVSTKLKRYGEAEQLYLEILPIQRRVLGDEHTYTLCSVSGLAQVYAQLGKCDDAGELFGEAVEGLRKVQGREHRDTIRCMIALAEFRTAQHRFEEAESLLVEALEISRRRLGDDHPWTLTSMNNLAIVYKEQGQYKQAESLLLKAFHGREAKLGPEHPDTIESLNQFVTLYESWNKPDEAEKWRAKLTEREDVEEQSGAPVSPGRVGF